MTEASYAMPAICVVDDSEDDLLALRRALRQLDVVNPLVHFTRAEQARAFLASEEGSSTNIGLLLLDINLPGNDGINFLGDVRGQPGHLCTPVVMFTTSDAETDIRRSYAAGANAFVTKPIATSSFTEAIENILAFWLRTARLPQPCLESI